MSEIHNTRGSMKSMTTNIWNKNDKIEIKKDGIYKFHKEGPMDDP